MAFKWSTVDFLGSNGKLLTLGRLLDAHPRLLNAQDPDTGNSAAMVAIDLGHYEILEFLIYKGINLNLQNRQGATALKYALYTEDVDIIKLLLSESVDLNTQDNRGSSVLMTELESVHNDTSILTEILSNPNIDLDIVSYDNYTPFQSSLYITSFNYKMLMPYVNRYIAGIHNFTVVDITDYVDLTLSIIERKQKNV